MAAPPAWPRESSNGRAAGLPAAAGEVGERLAADFLRRSGYKILRRNCRTRLGEIDIVARDGDEVVFVEVKTRSSKSWGLPEDAISAAKRRKISRAAIAFADRHRLRERALRFDVVAVLLEEGREPQVRLYKDAFTISSLHG